jgi:hypothetical protein
VVAAIVRSSDCGGSWNGMDIHGDVLFDPCGVLADDEADGYGDATAAAGCGPHATMPALVRRGCARAQRRGELQASPTRASLSSREPVRGGRRPRRAAHELGG